MDKMRSSNVNVFSSILQVILRCIVASYDMKIVSPNTR